MHGWVGTLQPVSPLCNCYLFSVTKNRGAFPVRANWVANAIGKNYPLTEGILNDIVLPLKTVSFCASPRK